MDKNSKIFIAGHNGLVGSSIVRNLRSLGYENLITLDHSELDLTNQYDVKRFFEDYKPEYVFLCAAKVGGILANSTYPAEFIYSNLQIQSNVINSSYMFGVKKLLFLGSSCIFGRECPQPIKEDYLLKYELEPTNEAYALAKIAGIKMCQSYNKQYGTNYISVMPTNLFGIGDSYDKNNSHVIPSIIMKLHEAKINNISEITLWGDGTPLREFLYVDDLSDACIFLMNNYNDSEIINIGTGSDIRIKWIADKIKEVVGYEGEIKFSICKDLNGTPRKLLDISKIRNLGWSSKTSIGEGLKLAYDDFLQRQLKKL